MRQAIELSTKATTLNHGEPFSNDPTACKSGCFSENSCCFSIWAGCFTIFAYGKIKKIRTNIRNKNKNV